MSKKDSSFQKEEVLHNLKHYLPAQAPLKDFIHHNTLHAFQELEFHQALQEAAENFGYKMYLSIREYRELFHEKKINEETLKRVLFQSKGDKYQSWFNKLINEEIEEDINPRIGQLRSNWKTFYKIDLDSIVHPILFRIIGNYLDQGVSIWNFPHSEEGFLSSLKELEKSSFVSFFKTDRARNLLLNNDTSLEKLLRIVVGDEKLYEQYIFDQQFAHPGWSGMVATVEDNPLSLIDAKNISLEELIRFELLLEIDALDDHFGLIWAPLGLKLDERPVGLFSEIVPSERFEVYKLWQEAFEWTYYDQVLKGLTSDFPDSEESFERSFQAMFCIDDRECSIRRYIEREDPKSSTYGTAGFFNFEFYFQPERGKFYTKVCPAPVTPKFLIKEQENTNRQKKDFHFNKHSHGLLSGWILTHTLGFWSALRLFLTVFKPSSNAAAVTSFRHMDKHSNLSIENQNGEIIDGMQVGFTVDQMTDRMEGLLKSIGLVKDFAPLVYIVSHGSSSVNNTHYAGYDCGACSGRPGSVNARVAAFVGNHPQVRLKLRKRGIDIPETTQFVGALHDTSRDEIMYYDLKMLSDDNFARHTNNEATFSKALSLNAKERSRRFMSINTRKSAAKVHEEVKLRTISLFEPRPELNHATNTLAIVGRREFSNHVFLDRRAFLNSYDYSTDPEGRYLLTILNAVAPVCGGINLEYYFSRVDNQKLGAGTKLPHNVMGLVGVANGIDGDLRTGLPSQMIEVHDPLRLMVIVEHFPEVVLETIQRNPATYNWFEKEWVKLAVVHPVTKAVSIFNNGQFHDHSTADLTIPVADDLIALVESSHDNIPVHILKGKRHGAVH
jgi:uncharacterized protein YbcC (UPF0753/DUF2309 family)